MLALWRLLPVPTAVQSMECTDLRFDRHSESSVGSDSAPLQVGYSGFSSVHRCGGMLTVSVVCGLLDRVGSVPQTRIDRAPQLDALKEQQKATSSGLSPPVAIWSQCVIMPCRHHSPTKAMTSNSFTLIVNIPLMAPY